MKNNQNINIGVIGLWHLGCVYATGLAKLGFNVEGYDENSLVIDNLNKCTAPVFEPEMESTIKEFLGKNLSFTNTIEDFFKDKKYIFITYDLPVNSHDQVSTKQIDNLTKIINKFGKKDNVLVISSQVPLGTCNSLIKSLNHKFEVIYFPENVRLGKAYETFLSPDRIILGSHNNKVMDDFSSTFGEFNCPFVKIGLESAEMVKHALNSYLATCVSFSSEISDLCELLGADMRDVVSALKTDRRVSPFAPINPGLGFAGATLGRDIQSLKNLAKLSKYKDRLFSSVYKVNQDRLPWLIHKIHRVYPKLNNLNIGILGLTYKPGTNTLRRSMSLELAKLLNKSNSNISAYDPTINDSILTHDYIKIEKSINSFFKDLDLVILMTEWPEFLDLDFKELSKLMRNKVIIDTKNFFDQKKFMELGFTYLGTGF